MRMTIVCLALLGAAGAGTAGEPIALPPPVMVPRELPPMGYYRVSAYEVWQNLAVDQRGFWRPRVIDTPYGAFYRYNGQPFPFTTTQPRLYTPTVTGTPYPLYMPYATD